MGWPIDMERKGCELIECWTHVVTFDVHLTMILTLDFEKRGLTLKFSGVITMQKVKVRGQKSRLQRSKPNFTVSGP